MRSIILLAVLLLSVQFAKGDPVVLGEGSALMTMPVASCSWSGGCGWNFQITNTSNVAVNGLSFGVYDLSPLTCFIPAGSSQTFFLFLVSGLQGTSAIDLYNSTTIYTGGSVPVANPEPTTMILLATGLAGMLGAGRRRRRSSNQPTDR